MKRLKTTVIATALSASLAAPAFATESPSVTATQFSATDMQQMFEQDAAPMQVAALSRTEMKETEGAWVVYAARFGWGAISSGVSYTVTNYGTPNFSYGDFARNVVYGGIGGLLGPTAATSATLGAGVSAGLGRFGY